MEVDNSELNNELDQKIPNKKNEKIMTSMGYISIIIVLLCLLFASVCLLLNKKSEETSNRDDYISESSIRNISELATLKAFYHNVGEFYQDPDGYFTYGAFQYGRKKVWVEYDGTVDIGIDASEIEIYGPDENDVIKVYVPSAKVLSIGVDEESVGKEYPHETGLFTNITSEDISAALATAQERMEEEANQDSSLLNSSRNNAKALIKNYIESIDEKYKE